MSFAVNIRLAKKEEHDIITQAFEEWYFPHEPLSSGFRIKSPSSGEKEFFTSPTNEDGLTLVATLPEENDRIVGFLVNTTGHHKFRDIPDKVGEEVDERRLAFIEALERKQNISVNFAMEKVFKLLALAVDPTVRGKDIGYKLFESALVMAKDLGYSVAKTCCTSKFSTKVALRLNMTPIASIEYKEFKDTEGNQIFTPSPEHTHVTIFVKILAE